MEPWRVFARALIEKHEGRRKVPYRCSEGFWTIGVGHKLSMYEPLPKYWTDAEVDAALDEDINLAVAGARRVVPGFEGLTDARKAVFVDLCFNLGEMGLEGFKNTLKAAGRGDWKAVERGLLKSKYARQVKGRAVENAKILVAGVMPA